MKFFVVAVLVCAALPAVLAGQWTVGCAPDANCPSIMMDITCNNATCAIVGGYSDTPFSVYYSKDAFATNEIADMKQRSIMLMAMASDKKGNGATAGMGIGDSSAILTSTDSPLTWDKSNVDGLVVGQDMKVVKQGAKEIGFAFTGELTDSREGLYVSIGGKNFTDVVWSAEESAKTAARYGAFPSPTIWYVTGGHWPKHRRSKLDAAAEAGKCVRLTEGFCQPVSKAHAKHAAAFNRRKSAKRAGKHDGYYGSITRTLDGGKTWKTLFTTDEMYFNDISCFDETHCVAVAEGSKSAAIYVIENEKVTAAVVDKDHPEYTSLFRATAISASEAYVGGGFRVGNDVFAAIYHTASRGGNWTLDSSVKDVGMITGFSFVTPTKGFAVGATTAQVSTVLSFA